MDLAHIKRHLGFSWKKGFIIIGYFLVISALNAFITSDVLFIIFAWPFYILPRQVIIAAVLEWAYAYAVATLILAFLERPKKKK